MLNSRCQPIAIQDVIKYLVGVLEAENLTSRVFFHRRQGYFYLFMGKYLRISPLEISREGFQIDVEIFL